MTNLPQQVRVQQAPPAPPPPVNPNDIGRTIEEAVNRALSEAGVAEQANARQSVREAMEQVRDEIAAARAQGREITIQPSFENAIPPQARDIAVAFFVMFAFVIVGLPLARAFARRMDRRGQTASASEIAPRLDRIEQAVEAIAIEVERVSEGQRYTTKAIADLRGLPGVNPAGWPAGARDGQVRDGQVREPERVPAGERRP